jgi:hypothetical protein
MDIEKLSFQIPEVLAKEFASELRIVIKHPWVIGIPVPERLLKAEVFKDVIKDCEIIITPKQFSK